MKSRILLVLMLALLSLALPAAGETSTPPAAGDTRALLIACSEFLTQADLGSSVSGNLHMVGSTLISAGVSAGNLSIEDGTIGTFRAFRSAVREAFRHSSEEDLSILYLCTHGVLSSADDQQVYLLLGDGHSETPLSAADLYRELSSVRGEKLLILDACFSGALIRHGEPHTDSADDVVPPASGFISPFVSDPSFHVLTSANSHESSWYYDSQGMALGAVSYFTSALSNGLGLYGAPEADLEGDGHVTLDELHRYLTVAVPSSSSQLLSSHAERLHLPIASAASLNRPLSGFSYGASLLSAQDPVFDFSYTVQQAYTGVQYRLIDYEQGRWNWENAKIIVESGEDGLSTLPPGRVSRSLTLENILPEDYGYLMLQVFAISGSTPTLCSERLIAVQPASTDAALRLHCPDELTEPGMQELPFAIHLSVPAELTVSVFDAEGKLVRRLCSSQLTHPSRTNLTWMYWDGRDTDGLPVVAGNYTLAVETRVCGQRLKASADVHVSSSALTP